MASDLTSRLRAVVEERLAVARAAVDACASERLSFDLGWPRTRAKDAFVAFVNANSPADAILAGERDLAVLERHTAIRENVEWWDCSDGTGLAAVCASCANREPREWDLGVGNYGTKPADWVSSYVLSPCPDIVALARRYRVEVDDA